MKKVLMLASVASMISQFNMNNIFLLKELGYEVHVACNFSEGSTCDQKSVENLKQDLEKIEVSYFQIDFSRDIKNIRRNILAYRQVRALLTNNKYEFMHCHSPIGGVIGRMAGRRAHIRTVYTAHGFHFYKGAPLKNWLIYYPIEWCCSWFTDVLLTINKEDYNFSQKHLHAKSAKYVPGIGIDITGFSSLKHIDIRNKKREELGVLRKTKIILSVGELNLNKNHEVVIKALTQLKDAEYDFFICGEGKLRDYLQKLITELGLQNKVKLLGYRGDIKEIYLAADLFVFPSKREGLSVALMEAMASGLPVICGRIRGNVDLIEDGKGGILISDVTKPELFREGIDRMLQDKELREKTEKNNLEKIQEFSLEHVDRKMRDIYVSCGD